MLVPLRVNVATGISAVPSAWVMTAVAVFPLAVPFTGRDWLTGTQAAHWRTITPTTVDPFCERVSVNGAAALGPYVPDHVPVKGPEDGCAEGLVGEDEPPPHAIVIAVMATTASRFADSGIEADAI